MAATYWIHFSASSPVGDALCGRPYPTVFKDRLLSNIINHGDIVLACRQCSNVRRALGTLDSLDPPSPFIEFLLPVGPP